MTGVVIRAKGLTKVYDRGTKLEHRALDQVDFEIHKGEIFGLIGADGAGKSTCFRILAGVLEPTSGEIEVLFRSPRESRQRVGYVTQPFSLYEDLSVAENLRYAAGLREVDEDAFAERSSRYLEAFDMKAFTERLAGRLSGGMKQKLALSCALIADPAVLLLDEPTTGVDPVSRRDFWDALAGLADRGMTIVVATPYLDEAERCTRIACMEGGKILAQFPPSELVSRMGLTRLEIRATDLQRAEEVLEAHEKDGFVADVQRFGDRLDVLVPDAKRDGNRVLATLAEAAWSQPFCGSTIRRWRTAAWPRCDPARSRVARAFPSATWALAERNGDLALSTKGWSAAGALPR